MKGFKEYDLGDRALDVAAGATVLVLIICLTLIVFIQSYMYLHRHGVI